MPGIPLDGAAMSPDSYTNGSAGLKNGSGFVHRFANHSGSYEQDVISQIDSRRFEDSLIFKDDRNMGRLFERLQKLRRNGAMCDVQLQVGHQDLYAHRVVLAAASDYLCELFTQHENNARNSATEDSGHQNGQGQQASNNGTAAPHATGEGNRQQMMRVDFRHLPAEEFELLIDYMYSSKLIAAPDQVKELYRIAVLLRMKSCAAACAGFLVARLTPENVVGLRACANGQRDALMAQSIDDFIQAHFHELTLQRNHEFTSLPSIQADLVVSLECRLPDERRTCAHVLDCIQREEATGSPASSTRDGSELDSPTRSYTIAWDHEFLAQALSDLPLSPDHTVARASIDVTSNVLRQRRLSSSPSRRRRDSSTDSLASLPEEVDWKMIAAQRISDTSYVALVVARRRLCSLSVRVRRPQPPPDESNDLLSVDVAPARASPSPVADSSPEEAPGWYLARMLDRRCSAGVLALGDRVFVCGGFDRGKCLDSFEIYDPVQNAWTALPTMGKRRGRLAAISWKDKVLAVCGSDGAFDLQCVEMFDPAENEWSHLTDLPMARSDVACCVIDDCLYVIGGWDGQQPYKDVNCYHLNAKTWTQKSPLPEGRTNSACIVHEGRILLIGGADRFGPVASVLCLDPALDKWTDWTPLPTARKGCGAALINNKLYVIGGADGSQSLSSVDILDLTTGRWTKGPELNVARTHVGVVLVHHAAGGRLPAGPALYAVGGYSGKAFLNSIEILCAETEEWQYKFL